MQSQRDYLMELLNHWRNAAKEKIGGPYGRYLPGAKKPLRVLRAEQELKRLHKIVNKWQTKASAAHKRALAKVDAKYQEARKHVHFDDPYVALKYIDKLRKGK